MSQKFIGWLSSELPKLVERNIISHDQRDAIVKYFDQERRDRPNVGLVAFSIIGAILLAAGIILILAHNWSNLSRPMRTVLSFLPLVAGQAIGFWTVFRRRHSVAWREGIAAFLFLAIGSTIALISQTYHIQGDLKTYLLTWMLLSIPLAYVFSSTTASALYIAVLSSWAAVSYTSDSPAIQYWMLLAAVLPMLVLKRRGNNHSTQVAIIGWFVSLSLIAGVAFGHHSVTEGFRVISFLSLFLCCYIIGQLQYSGRSTWTNPFNVVGIIGLAVTYLFLSYRDSWDHLSYQATKTYGRSPEITGGDWIVSLGLPLLAFALLGLALSRRHWVSLGMGIGLPAALAGFQLSYSTTGQVTFSALFNLYVFVGGIAYLVMGIKSSEAKWVNFGFGLVAAVILLRFFDADLSFVWRGIVFVLLGAGFLSTNVLIAKRRAAN